MHRPVADEEQTSVPDLQEEGVRPRRVAARLGQRLGRGRHDAVDQPEQQQGHAGRHLRRTDRESDPEGGQVRLADIRGDDELRHHVGPSQHQRGVRQFE